MDTITSPSGLRIHFPSTYRISRYGPRLPSRGARLRQKGSGRETDTLIDALTSQQMDLIDMVELEPVQEPTAASGRRRHGTPKVPDRQEVSFELTVAANENAVLVLEQDGMYSWRFPNETGRAAIEPSRRRRGGEPATAGTRLVFHVEIFTEPTPVAAARWGGFGEYLDVEH